MLVACFLTEVKSRPSNNESSEYEEVPMKGSKAIPDTEDGSISYQADSSANVDNDQTRDIVDKIKTINSFLSKPSREQINYNKPYSEKTNGIDRETLEKIQQIIASAKVPPKSSIKNTQTNSLNEDDDRNDYSRSIKLTPKMFVPNPVLPYMPYPYVMNLPVVPSPYNEMLGGYNMNNNLKSPSNEALQSRQQSFFQGFPSFPSFPSFSIDNFQFQPFAQYFPVLIKNPIVAFAQGGGWDNFVEYGQNADVCSRKQKSSTDDNSNNVKNLEETRSVDNNAISNEGKDDSEIKTISRQSRALKKRTVSPKVPEQEIEEVEISKKLYPTKTSSIRKTTKRPVVVEPSEDFKHSDPEGDLRFPFSDFTWFGNKKPVAPSPGFFINKLKVKRGGVAIAGPGGIATAGRGGTAIVGPGGLAYTKPGGLAIAGPHARVVAISPYTDPLSLISRPHHRYISEHAEDGYDYRALDSYREGKFYKPAMKNQRNQARAEVYNYDGENFVQYLTKDPTFVFNINPRALAVNGENGISISNPISNVVIRKGEPGSIIHNPLATAVVGPGGFAHAESELNVYEYDIK